jgi:hypothetical protein
VDTGVGGDLNGRHALGEKLQRAPRRGQLARVDITLHNA